MKLTYRNWVVFGSIALAIGCGCSSGTAPSTSPGTTSATSQTSPPAASSPMPASHIVVGTVKNGVFVASDGKPLCPVDGMELAETKGAESQTYHGVKYYFCMPSCAKSFKQDPAKYALAKGEKSKKIKSESM